MEQLTQMELLHVKDLIGAEALALRKCQLYEQKCKSDALKGLFRDGASIHQAHIQEMMQQLRRHNGREGGEAPPVH